ncbi:MAG: hypothetical protein SWH68_16800 [Thermodesulfobacteriota bacterium]|nr:hypothetical protein [Thermodesulfobacteriota bacterium]
MFTTNWQVKFLGSPKVTFYKCIISDGFEKSFQPRSGIFAVSNLREAWFFTTTDTETPEASEKSFKHPKGGE